jgi:hypothetical protein
VFSSRIVAATIAASLAAIAAPAQAGLIGYYTFEGNANDVSGQGHHGTLSAAAPTLTAAGTGITKWGDASSRAYSFGAGGANTFIELPLDINPAALPELTMGAWVKVADLTPVIRGILSHDDVDFDRTLDLDTRGGGGLQYCMFVGLPNGGNCGGAATSEWTFLVARYDATLGVAQLTVGETHFSKVAANNGGGLNTTFIGRNPSFDSPFVGLIDNVFFFDDYLSNDQLNDIYRQGIDTVPEPTMLMLAGTAALVLARRRRQR